MVTKGQRIQMHPATDLWMKGARFGVVEGIVDKHRILVKLDKANKYWVRLTDLVNPDGTEL